MDLRSLLLHGIQAGSLGKRTFQSLIHRPFQQLRHQRLRLLRCGIRSAAQDTLLRPKGIAAAGRAEIPFHKVQVVNVCRLLTDADRTDSAANGHQQNRRQSHCHPAFFHTAPPPSAAGQRTVNTAPPSGRLAADTVPPRFVTVSCTMERPRPVPPAARERALSTR